MIGKRIEFLEKCYKNKIKIGKHVLTRAVLRSIQKREFLRSAQKKVESERN